MLKKISKILLLAVAGLSLTFGFVACSNDDDDDDENQNNNSSGTDSSSSTSGSSSVAYLGSLDSSDGKLTISSDGFVFQQKEDDGSYSNSLKGSVAKATDEYVYLKAEYDWVTDWAKRGDEASGGSGIDVAYFYAVLTAPASGATEGSFKSYSSDEEGYTAKKAYIVYTTSTAMAFDTIFVAADNTFKGSLAGTEIASGECKLDGSSLYLKYTSAGTTTYLKVTLDTSAKIYTFDAITGSIDEAAYTGAKSETIDTGSSSSSSGNGDSENSGNTGKTDDKTGDNTGKTDDDNTGKTETGDATYTWVSEEGNLTIATKADATFTATESSMNIIVFSGTYTKTGNSLVVTIKKELNDDDSALVDVKEEETLNFTIGANNVLTLASGGDTEHELVNYTVYHSFETLEGEYVVDETLTETLEGILGDKTAAVAKTVTGFTTDAITQETIGKDTKVTIKYKRITVTISFDCGEYATVESITGKYGATVTAPENPTREGYTFKAWEPVLPETFTENITVNATWEAKNVSYTVYHSFETLEGEYEVDETMTETLEGVFDGQTAASAKTVTGFTSEEFKQEKIQTGTTVTIKYKRINVTISFDCGEYATVESINGKYGATVTAPENPTREGYTFKAWEPALPETFTEDMTVNATWERETGDVSGIIY